MGPHVEEWLGFGEGAVEDGEGVAGFDEVGAHGLAHDAGSDPAHTGVGWANELCVCGVGHGMQRVMKVRRANGSSGEVNVSFLFAFCIYGVIFCLCTSRNFPLICGPRFSPIFSYCHFYFFWNSIA